MQSFIATASLVAIALLAGCATKSPPKSADIRQQALTNVTLPSAWKAGGTTGSIGDDWLITFDDEQLNLLVREAITNNPDLRIGATRVEQAAYYVQLARAPLRPSLGIVGTGGIKGGGGSDPSSALQGVTIAASWEPDLWGRMRYGRNAAQSAYASSQADFEFARQSMAAATRGVGSRPPKPSWPGRFQQRWSRQRRSCLL
jgi:multidrug efflux system outer membrane protein